MELSALIVPAGIALCEKQDGMFLVLKSADDLKKLKELLDKITMVETDL